VKFSLLALRSFVFIKKYGPLLTAKLLLVSAHFADVVVVVVVILLMIFSFTHTLIVSQLSAFGRHSEYVCFILLIFFV